jgi:hypothetical protein
MISPVQSREASGVSSQSLGTRRAFRPGIQPRLSAFPGLGTTDRQDLSNWLRSVADSGIDAVLDLSARPWRLSEGAAIIGVFETARPTATWLIVRHADEWLLLRPADGFISAPSATLRDVLGGIELQGRPGGTARGGTA